MGYPRQSHCTLRQRSAAISQDRTLFQKGLDRAYPIRAVLSTHITGRKWQIDIMTLLIREQHTRLTFVPVWPVRQDTQGVPRCGQLHTEQRRAYLLVLRGIAKAREKRKQRR